MKDLGYKVPEALIDLIQKKEWVRRGVVEVWNCKKCSWTLEQFVPLSAVGCPKGHGAEKVWESGLGGTNA